MLNTLKNPYDKKNQKQSHAHTHTHLYNFSMLLSLNCSSLCNKLFH